MDEEEAFLAGIQANPDDEVIRLVYADWLEERDDPRHEFLRLEHQLHQIFPRLAQLRNVFDPAWLAKVGRRWKVVLASYDAANKIQLIKVVRELTGMGLAEAKNLVETPRGVIRSDLPRDEAEEIANRLRNVAKVVVEPCLGK